jgi:hypothetical protein
MLFGYPIEATNDNWLHECLGQILEFIHQNLATGNLSTEWSSAISEAYRSKLENRLKLSKKPDPQKLSLGDKFKNYQDILKTLTPSERQQIIVAFREQNNIAHLLAGDAVCEIITDLPEVIHKPIKILFESAFKLLTDFGVRDTHYQKIYDEIPDYVCPFCGCEYFDAPGIPREALDHYLPKNEYFFAGVNLNNLVPMGNRCNSGYKGPQDILRRDDGSFRKSFNPYNHEKIEICLNNSKPFAGERGTTGEKLPQWKIDFIPNSEEIITWDEVFKIRERYEKKVLNPSFDKWLRGFRSWCKNPRNNPVNSDQEWMDALEAYASYYESLGFDDRSFLKAAVFKMLYFHCKNGDQDLIQFIRDFVIGVNI